MNCENIVAIATPATPKLNTITSTILRHAFIIPAAIRNISGLLVSPTALRTAAP
jgi:hypothetical protein